MKTVIKILIAIAVLLAIVFVVQAARIALLFSQVSGGVPGIPGSVPSGSDGPALSRLPLPDLVRELTRPSEWLEISKNKISEPFSLSDRHLVKLEESIADIGEVAPEVRQRFEKELPARLMARVKKLPEPPEIPEFFDSSAPVQNFKAIRDTSRYWYLMSRWFFSKGQHEIALAIGTSILLLAHEVETCNVSAEGVLTRMMAISVRNIGTTAIIEMTDHLNLPAARLKSWTAVLMRLHDNIPGIERAFLCQKKMMLSAFHELHKANRNRLTEALCDPGRQKKYIGAFYDPLIDACNKPYSAAMEASANMEKETLELEKILDPGLRFLGYFFFPEDFFMKFMLSIGVPSSYRGTFDNDFNSRQVFRASIIALALRAYQIEHKSLPDTLETLEKWLGKSLPTDVYTDKPMYYNNSGGKILYSDGPDGKPDTPDDTVFMPLKP